MIYPLNYPLVFSPELPPLDSQYHIRIYKVVCVL